MTSALGMGPATSEVATSSSSAVPKMGITIFGCGQDEAVLFREMAPRFGVMPTITDAAVSEVNIETDMWESMHQRQP